MKKQTNSKSLVIARNRKMAIIKPQLTSLIDVMTILLVFLLKSFSVEGNLISVSTDMNLAESTSRKAPVGRMYSASLRPVLALTIWMDG
jgi:biopolymer transport protein ExbD